MQRWLWAWLALVVCWPSQTAAAQSRARLAEALLVEPDKSGCITHAALLARVLHWLQPSVEIGDVHVLVRGRARPPSFVVRRGSGAPAERSFDVWPTRCRDRVDAIALAIALALEEANRAKEQGAEIAGVPELESAPPPAPAPAAERVASPSAAQRPPVLPGSTAGVGGVASSPRGTAPGTNSREPDGAEPTLEPDRAAPETPIDPSASGVGSPQDEAASAKRSFHVRLRGGADGLIEVLPEPVLGLHLGGELSLDLAPGWSVGLDALVSSESETPVAGGRVLARLYAGRAVACFGWPVGNSALEGCGGIGLGASVARGEFALPASTTLFWAAVLARTAVRYPREGALAVRLAIDGLVNVARPEYQVRGVGGTALSAGPLGAAASLELIVALE